MAVVMAVAAPGSGADGPVLCTYVHLGRRSSLARSESSRRSEAAGELTLTGPTHWDLPEAVRAALREYAAARAYGEAAQACIAEDPDALEDARREDEARESGPGGHTGNVFCIQRGRLTPRNTGSSEKPLPDRHQAYDDRVNRSPGSTSDHQESLPPGLLTNKEDSV
jgi:hypothetical protein